MEKRKGKIGINTTFIIFILAIFSPTVRIFGTYTATKADQAAWLTPIFASIVFAYLILKLNILFVDHPGLSLVKIYEKIVGKLLAKIIASIYLIWILILICVNAKSYTMRLTTVLYPNINENLFLIVTIVIIGTLIVKSGLVVAARMFRIFFGITLTGFIILSSMLIPKISIDMLTPISYLDILPIMKGSVAIISIWSYATIFFIMSDNMIGMKEFKKRGLQSTIYLLISTIILLATMIGTCGSSLISQTPVPYLVTVEQLTLLNSITGLEAILIVLWILSDFAILSLFTLSCLKLIKYIFNIEDASIYIHILMILIFFGTNMMSINYYQLREFSYKYVYHTSIVLFTLIPIIMSWIYKIRNKARKALRASRES